MVTDGETAEPLYLVSILNVNTGESSSTDEQGKYSLRAKAGEVISFSYMGYHSLRRIANPDSMLYVELLPLSVQLKEYVLHPGYTPFQRDSAEMATLYSKELNTKPIKVGFNSANGGGFSGLIGGPVQKMSKSYKQNKRFKENFQRDMEQKFIDTRYTPALVTTLTGYTGDTLAVFMNRYPMEYTFARTATDLELKMWIRDNYRLMKKRLPAAPSANTSQSDSTGKHNHIKK